jgi:hypothetical protein
LKNIFLFVFVALSFRFVAQTFLPISYDTTFSRGEFIIGGSDNFHSTSLQNDLSKKMFRGGFITEDIKNNSLKKQRPNNYLGIDTHIEIDYFNYNSNLFGLKNWGFLVKAAYFSTGSAAYAEDAFALAFYGNEFFHQQTANFSGTSTNFMNHYKVGFGAVHKKTKSSISLNFVNLANYFSGEIRKGELSQNFDYSEIGLLLSGDFSITEESQLSNGLGVSVDFDVKIPVSWKSNQTAYIQIQAKNVGFVSLNNTLKSYQVDTTYLFQGFTFQELLNSESLFSENFSILDTLNIQSKNTSKMLLLPAFVQVGKIVDEHNLSFVQSFFGIRMYPTLFYTPLLYVGLNFKPEKHLNFGLLGTYGGFGSFRAGFYTNFQMKPFTLGIGTEDIFGLVSKKAMGESLNIRLRWLF